MESFLFHPVQLDKKMNICYHSKTQSPPGDIVYHRGVAQLVARVLWEHDAAGSSPVTPTISSVHSQSDERSIFFCPYWIAWSRDSTLFVMP